MKALLIVLLIFIVAVLFTAYAICRSAQKHYPDQKDSHKYYDDEGNEYLI